VKLFFIIVAAIIAGNVALEVLGMVCHFAGRYVGKVIVSRIPKSEPIIEPPAKPDGFSAWLQGSRK
jgi:hypothetical protein